MHNRIISLKELCSLIACSRSKVYEMLNQKSKRYDASFPTPLKIGGSLRWRLDEIDDWLELKSTSRFQSQVTANYVQAPLLLNQA